MDANLDIVDWARMESSIVAVILPYSVIAGEDVEDMSAVVAIYDRDISPCKPVYVISLPTDHAELITSILDKSMVKTAMIAGMTWGDMVHAFQTHESPPGHTRRQP